ncbi:conserved exported hypothetical protein [Tenacibaculum maritimum]|uniref:tetratricopeptide repeat protein n=1 Tax=Tenacibaculum maritimum TaxID=107401 RepID=UPI0012E58C0A|nr:hypothetical protein [Tenacibaculum maritimum]CAA0249929.1 conserved exported hypothetical protein [Tenacibaculum maritimum]
MLKRIVLITFIGLLHNPSFSFAQSESSLVVLEKQQVAFQDFFFKALSNKAIENYQKAIENLENCNQIIPNNKAVLFEFSKNYLKLNRFFEAIEYGNKALKAAPQNLWILEHLVTVYRKNRDFTEAIKIQQKIINKHPLKKRKLVFLYLENRNYSAAKTVLQELEEAKLLTPRLRRIKDSLRKREVANKSKKNTVNNYSSEINKSFTQLKEMLNKYNSTQNNAHLLKYSQKGIDLYPAQPFVYLMKARALNNQKSYKKAIETLQNGIDFVIDNHAMEVSFYLELAKAHQGIGNIKEAKKYRKKAKK